MVQLKYGKAMSLRFLLCICLFSFPVTLAAESGFYLGGGFSAINLDIDHPSINSQSDAAFHILAGTRFEKWGFEIAATGGMSFSTGETPNIFYPPDSAEYLSLDLGVKRFFNVEAVPNLYPWIGAGLGLHLITWDTYYYNVEGYGYSLTAGIDYQLRPHWLVRGGVVYSGFESDDTYEYGPYDGNTIQLNIGIIYLF
jgi:opacity protein-like surface antigen